MIINNVNPNKLHDELINAGITPILVRHNRIDSEIIAESTEIIFAETTDLTAVQAVIDAHNPEPIPQEPTDKERIAQLEQIIDTMLTGGIAE